MSHVFLSAATSEDDSIILLDIQSGVHLLHSPAIAIDIQDAPLPVTIQGITGNRVKITKEATIKDIGINGYYSPRMSANIISYSKLKETHSVYYDEDTDTFVAVAPNGPKLTFHCVKGHYVMDMVVSAPVYMINSPAKYSTRQLASARRAYEFIKRMGYVSYKGAAEIAQRGCIKDIDFTRADLVNAQNIYGTPAANQLGQGTQRTAKSREDDQVPVHESVAQELQVDLFFFLGNVFFLSISVLLGLIMVTHLGPGQEKTTGFTTSEGSRSKAGKALLLHLNQYKAKGFHIRTVTSDGEGAVKSARTLVEDFGAQVNILGHGSHTPHAEAAIRHVKNKARSTLYSLPFPLPLRLAPALIAFVVHTANMVPKCNAPGHLPAFTAFRGRTPSYKVDAPHAFGTSGFLQRASGTHTNTAAPRADYCIWLGTTRNLKGTHRCFNLSTLAEVTGDTFRPAPLTSEAIDRLRRLAGTPMISNSAPNNQELPLSDPNSPYALDPNRGVEENDSAVLEPTLSVPILVSANNPPDDSDQLELTTPPVEIAKEGLTTPSAEIAVEDTSVTAPEEDSEKVTEELVAKEMDVTNATETDQAAEDDVASQVAHMRNEMNKGYNLRKSTKVQHVYAALTIKAATASYGEATVRDAVTLELQHCISKKVFKGLSPLDHPHGAIPSKMFLTPKKLPSGALDKIKARLVAGGHRQDRSLYSDQETSSPTVSLTAVFAQAAIAAHRGEFVLTLDHKAAYLNAMMKGPEVKMILTKEVSEILCEVCEDYKAYRRDNGTIIVQLQKALYGCIQSAVLWYEELSSTLEGLGYSKNPYDTCVFNKVSDGVTNSILVYVDDLLLTSAKQSNLDMVAQALRERYGGVTVRTGQEHDFLGINWDFRTPGEVSLSMEGYVSNILNKYNVSKKAMTPATDMLFRSNESCAKLNHKLQQTFYSCVMELHYLAKRIRGDILTAVSFCATRVLFPNEDDFKKLARILSYLLYTRDQKMVLKVGANIEVNAYVDASFGIYEDMKSVTGIVIMIGQATIYVKSGKQKIVTRSSTEAELVGISDALSQILWTREFLLHQGFRLGPATVYQDNKSTICLANKGRSTSERTRHVKVRYFFIQHYLESKEIIMEYLPTGEMLADLFTKPLHGTTFLKLRDLVSGSAREK